MNDHLAVAVGRVIQGVLALERELRSGSTRTLPEVRGQLIDLVDGLSEEARRAGEREQDFDLARCALVCWIDELMTLHCDWPFREQFRAQCLELHYPELHNLKGRRPPDVRRPVEGPTLFYEMADLARTRPEVDALETFYICVALGFEGQLYWEHERRAWMEATYGHIKERQRDGPPGPDRAGGPGLQPLRGARLRLGVALLVAGSALATFLALLRAVHLRPY